MANQIAGIRFQHMYKKGEGNIADFISRNCIPYEIDNDSDKNEMAPYVNFAQNWHPNQYYLKI